MNTFSSNYENGIFTDTKNGLRCDALITYNKIEKNKMNGIFCKGENNHTRIEHNQKICNNAMAGIRASEDAVLVIIDNIIMLNFG